MDPTESNIDEIHINESKEERYFIHGDSVVFLLERWPQ